jgi:multicomponent Na+:H+ antiporter subunit D
LFPISVRAFFYKETSTSATGVMEAPTLCLVAIGVTTAMCLVLFFFPDPLYRLAVMLVD